jgi:hypothetical protein
MTAKELSDMLPVLPIPLPGPSSGGLPTPGPGARPCPEKAPGQTGFVRRTGFSARRRMLRIAALACLLSSMLSSGVWTASARAQPASVDPQAQSGTSREPQRGASAEPPSAGAASSALPAAPAELKGEKVYVGVYLNQIPEMNLKENHFTADFYVWFRYKTESFEPWKSCDVVGGKTETKEVVYQTKLGDTYYASCHVVAVVTQFWDVARFPLDNHELQISLEDNANEEFKVEYLADTQNSGASPDLQVPGWTVRGRTALVAPHRYQTNYGDTSLPSDNESVYSRFVFSVPLTRQGIGYFLKLFLGLFVATAIAFLAMFIRPTEVDPRFGLGIGAIFAAVASEYVVTASLPETNKLTMADMLHMLAFVFIFLSLVESTISLALWLTEDEAKIRLANCMDRWSFSAMVGAYVAGTCFCVVWA